MIHKLPTEIISKIFAQISIKDARACTDAYYARINISTIFRHSSSYSKQENIWRRMHEVLVDRLSDRMYMGKSFPDSTELMKRMIAYGVWASGSRMLDFFVGESIGPESDWDFYIPTNTKKIIYFMEYMKTIGVTWISTVDYYVNRIESNDKDITMPYTDLEYLSKYTGPGIPEYIRQHIVNIYRDDHDIDNLQASNDTIYVLEKSDGSHSSVRVHTGTYGSISIDSIIRGKLHYRGVETNIQLILTGTEKYANMNAIRNFDLSIVQGAMTGFMAFHMYSSHAYNKSGSIWIVDEANDIQTDITKERIKKYEKRGFKLQDGSVTINENCLSPDRLIIRQMGDPDTDTIVYTSGINQRQDPYYLLKQSIYNYTWTETHSAISSNFIVDERRAEMVDRIKQFLYSQDTLSIETIEAIIYGRNTEPDINPRYVYSSINKDYYSKFRPLANSIIHI